MNKTLFYHGTTSDGLKYTIAGVYETPTLLRLGISLCTARDSFVKKLGRVRAEGRLKSKSKFGNGPFTLAAVPEKGKEINTFVVTSKNLGDNGSKWLKRYFLLGNTKTQ